ncbi:MAG: threonine/serine exporter family protein [Spirochaetes bacterium]|nr:threonine/serine exporter family protein [Spirochaetota bacterium]
MHDDPAADAVNLALAAGRLMLANGGETYRVEETIELMCLAGKLEQVQCFCIPTGIFFSASSDSRDFSRVIRLRGAAIDLEIIDLVNNFARQYTEGHLDSAQAWQALRDIERAPRFNTPTRSFFAGVAAGFFALLYGGTLPEFCAAFLTSALVTAGLDRLVLFVRSYYIRSILGGVLLATVALLFARLGVLLGWPLQFDAVIVGALMPLVPGVAITNALRDILSGDYVSGVSKLSEAVFIAVGMALGTGVVLKVAWAWL